MNRKDLIIKGSISILMLGIIIVVTFFIINYDNTTSKEKIDLSLDLNSEIVSTDPKISAANFIKYNGTMGDIQKVDENYFGPQNLETNADRRIASLEKVKDAIIPDSPIISGRELENAKNQLMDFPVFYTIENVSASEPSEIKPLIIEHDEIGSTQYESVDVLIDFTSIQDTFYWPTDVTGDSIITQERAKDEFKDVKVTLVKSGDSWFIYDVEDIEYKLNVRMSTWSGRGKDDVSTDQKTIAEYKLNYE